VKKAFAFSTMASVKNDDTPGRGWAILVVEWREREREREVRGSERQVRGRERE
jgi:hypothetical protein